MCNYWMTNFNHIEIKSFSELAIDLHVNLSSHVTNSREQTPPEAKSF
jgi:hypothetical protein